mmetsp:Transcript_106556/g.184079  ORF Transcript_106556/g.184079 Transcript_106556/m.184079 type:complete len:815 (-) Transcript_106556:120-2564(-)
MLGLRDGWDDIFDDKDEPSDSGALTFESRPAQRRDEPLGARLAQPAWESHASSFTLGSSSKAAELLRRANNNFRAAVTASVASDIHAASASPITPGLEREQGLGLTANADAAGPLPEEAEAPHAAEGGEMAVDHPVALGVFGAVDCPRSSDPAVRTCKAKAPHTFSRAFRFRASMRRGLIALPVVQSERGGSFRVKLLRLAPDRLSSKPSCSADQAELPLGVGLLQAQIDVGFAEPDVAARQGLRNAVASIPQPLRPKGDCTRAFLERCIEEGNECLGRHASETFELLDAFLGDHSAQAEQHMLRRFSAWLAQVNARTVRKHLGQIEDGAASASTPNLPAIRASESQDDLGSKLKTVFHYLTANSVRGALRELKKLPSGFQADGATEEAVHVHFDRLATIMAACGGSVATGVQARLWIQRQIAEWRWDSVPELMGTALWRIYCLLAGDVFSISGDALDWRTAFGMHLWYCKSGDHKGQQQLLGAVESFEEVLQRYGGACRFRPAPAYALGAPSAPTATAETQTEVPSILMPVSASNSRAESPDLQFNMIRAAAGLLDWSDLQHYDYSTYTSRPFDVAFSWHLAMLLIALRGPEGSKDFSGPGFQTLTQQYCWLLELSGFWEWAVYAAQFVQDARARSILVRGLIRRNAVVHGGASLEAKPREHWFGVPPAWAWQAQALRCEKYWDWPAAVVCWLQSCTSDGVSGADRAVIILVGFLQSPAILKHRQCDQKPFMQEETITLAPMAPQARWLLTVLEELKPKMETCGDVWAKFGMHVLQFLQRWADAGCLACRQSVLGLLCHQCSTARQLILGIPW